MQQDAVKNPLVRLVGVVASLLLLTCTLSFAQETAQDIDQPVVEVEKPEVTIPFDEIRTFADIFARVKKDYVESVEDKELMKSAIRGMLSGLDPHSSYLDKTEYQDLYEGTTGEFGLSLIHI